MRARRYGRGRPRAWRRRSGRCRGRCRARSRGRCDGWARTRPRCGGERGPRRASGQWWLRRRDTGDGGRTDSSGREPGRRTRGRPGSRAGKYLPRRSRTPATIGNLRSRGTAQQRLQPGNRDRQQTRRADQADRDAAEEGGHERPQHPAGPTNPEPPTAGLVDENLARGRWVERNPGRGHISRIIRAVPHFRRHSGASADRGFGPVPHP